MIDKKFRVLVIDDSPHVRRVLAKLLTEEIDGAQVDTAGNGQMAMSRAGRSDYDLITLDLNMPVMDGYTFLRLLRKRIKTPVLAVSSITDSADIELALELGVDGVLTKPTDPHRQMETIREELRLKIRQLLPDTIFTKEKVAELDQSKLFSDAAGGGGADRNQGTPAPLPCPVVVIGCSSGGPPTLQYLLSGLPPVINAIVVVAQHMPSGFTTNMSDRLNRLLRVPVKELCDSVVVEPGTVLFCPGGHDVRLESSDGRVYAKIEAAQGESAKWGTPSVDKLFESAAEVYGERVLGLVLTGMGKDGADGVRAIKAKKGRVIAESQATAAIYGMPKEAVLTGCVDEQLPLPDIAINLIKAVTG
jgi:two-component system chemotaxis response regulator CheB